MGFSHLGGKVYVTVKYSIIKEIYFSSYHGAKKRRKTDESLKPTGNHSLVGLKIASLVVSG